MLFGNTRQFELLLEQAAQVKGQETQDRWQIHGIKQKKMAQTPMSAMLPRQTHMPTFLSSEPELKTSGYRKNRKSSPGGTALCLPQPGAGAGSFFYLLRSEPYCAGTPDALGERGEAHPFEAGHQLAQWATGSPGSWSSRSQQPEHIRFCWGWEGGEPSRALLQGGAETYSQQMVLSPLLRDSHS